MRTKSWQRLIGFYIIRAAPCIAVLHAVNCQQETQKYYVPKTLLFAQSPVNMQRLFWYFHRLRSMDGNEILWRMRALMRGYLDAIRIPLRVYPTLNSAGRPEIDQPVGGFECWPRSGVVEWNRKDGRFERWSLRLLQKADLALQDKLSFFDVEGGFLGNPIDWQRDISSGKSGRLRQSVFTDYRDFERVGDCKLVWEPNRHHQIVVLARAYRVTKDKVYAQKAVSLMSDWIGANPFGYGMNWRSPLEVGIRLINWVWAIDLIRDSGAFSKSVWANIVETVFLAEWDTQRKFSKGSSANNHLIGEAAGVFIAACYFPSMPKAALWRTKSRQVLEREILAQSYADGCTREHAFGYQLFVLQFLTLSAVAARKIGEPFSPQFMNRLHQMYIFMADVCADTGRQPNIGDADNGYVLDLGELPDLPNELLSVGAHLFDDDGLQHADASETAYWLFGASSLDRRSVAAEKTSQAYPESGYFILRSDAAHQENGERLSMVFDCAELGYGNIAAHGHADCLSFTLSIGDAEFLVDPGTYDYFSFPDWRRYFRETRAHNTATIDGVCQSEALGPFLWGKRANAKLLGWQDDESKTEVVGQHDGYTRLADPVVHRRKITLNKISNNIEISDCFESQAAHRVRRYFHLSPDCRVDRMSDSTVRIVRSNASLKLEVDRGSIDIQVAGEDNCVGWVSSGYHVRLPSHCLVIENEIDGNCELVTKLSLSA